MKNYIQKGERVEIQNSPTAYTSGQLVTAGELVGIAVNTTIVGQSATVLLSGVVQVPKATGAITFGQKLYHDTAAGNVTTVAGVLKQAGFAVSNQLSGDSVVSLKLMF
jgi:predicted RecA/RadA family phage recombinase